LNANWRAEMAQNAEKKRGLLALDTTGFYRSWFETGSPNGRSVEPAHDQEDDTDAG
jgi:hypothetical protein